MELLTANCCRAFWRSLRPLLLFAILCSAGSTAQGQQASVGALPAPPAEGDYTAASLRAYQDQLRAGFGGRDADVPLDVKAEFYEWVMFRYHHAPGGQVYDWSMLPGEVGKLPQWVPCSDTSTWNGALLCALSYKYAVTRDPRTLERIAQVLAGMRLCLEVTQRPGLIARSVRPADGIHHENMLPYTAPDGRQYFYWDQPAKGTYNQIVGGYAKVMMHAYAGLPPDVQRMAREDFTALVLHVIDHDYQLTNRDGSKTPYGNITPRLGSHGVPYNAQVAYQIVAAGRRFPPDDPAARRRIEEQFDVLRRQHHVYYEDPRRHLVRPQNVAASPLVKVWNDRAHAVFAAFAGLELDIDERRKAGQPLDATFVHQLGATLLAGMDYMDGSRNALCHLMCAAMLSDPQIFEAVVRHKPNTVRGQIERGLELSFDELRRYPLDRFSRPGREIETNQPQSVDQFQPGYRWHQPQNSVWEATGPATDSLFNTICYLHAYWLMRYYRLDGGR